MKTLFGLFLSITITYVIGEETTSPDFGPFVDTTLPDFGPFEWNYFHTRVQNTLATIQSRIHAIELDMKIDPQKRQFEALEIEADLRAIAEIEQMIRTQLKDLNLNRDQKEFVEISANQALRFNQQLNDLRQKLKQHISGVTGVFYADTTLPDFGPFETTLPPFGPFETTLPPFGPYEWRAFQQRVRQMISMIEIRLLLISHQIKNSPQLRALEKMQIEKEIITIDELKTIIKKFSGAQNLDFIQKSFIYTSEALVLKLRRALTQLILESKQF